MTRYAETTKVSSEASIMEIRRTLTRYGADAFMFAEDDIKAVISFKFRERFYKIPLPLPNRKDRGITHTPTRNQIRSPQAQEAAYEQAVRQRWRALALIIKAILEGVESGIPMFMQMLQAFILLPDGQTVGEWMEPQIERVYLEGKMPAFLPMLEHKE